MESIYLDHNATTPLDPRVRARMEQLLSADLGNASSVHAWGRLARGEIDLARDEVAALLGARPGEIVFTGGGTESDNLGVIGMALAHGSKGKHLITSPVEHHAVLHAVEYLGRFHGWDISYLPVDSFGQVDPEALRALIRPDTALVSVMSANNETGTRQPVLVLSEICRDHGVLFHTDAIQSVGKERVNVKQWPVSALSLCAHKFYGPPGVGVLFLREGTPVQRLHHGGFHENERRPGTENAVGIVGLAEALKRAQAEGSETDERLRPVVEQIWEGLSGRLMGVVRNGHPVDRLGNTLNVSIEGCHGESLLMGLDLEGLGVSSGSACMVGSVQPSHVLLAMGVKPELAASAVRFSLGKSNSAEQVAEIVERVVRTVERQRKTVKTR
jgi:cysteine desulfurase